MNLFYALLVFICNLQSNTKIAEFKVPPSLFSKTDQSGISYIVSDNILFKVDSTGKILMNYSDKATGNITYIDITNPLKILVLFGEVGRLQVLDNKFSLISDVDLRSINIIQPKVLCLSQDGGIWIFDQQDFKLKKLAVNLSDVSETQNLNQLLNLNLNPSDLIDNNGFLYLTNSETGVLVFDRYGTYFKNIPIQGLQRIQISNSKLIGLVNQDNKSSVLIRDLNTLEERMIPIPESELNELYDARIVNRKLFLFKKEIIVLYSL